MRYWLVMPAAGSGRRFGAAQPKQYATLAGRSVIEWSLAPFLADSRCAGIRVAIAADDPHWRALRLEDPAGRLKSVEGGPERWASVRQGLAALPPEAQDDWVLVHDAARPCLSADDLSRLLDTLEDAPEGALLAQPLSETLKRATNDVHAPTVANTIERAGVWRAQTPQASRARVLLEALDRCAQERRVPTDEAQALEGLGLKPRLVVGAATNLKITSADDLRLAEAILAQRNPAR